MKLAPAPTSKDQSTAIVGLAVASSADTAKAWVCETMGKTKIEGVIDVYDKYKGKDFNGITVIEFASTEKPVAAMKRFNDGNNVFAESRTYMNRMFQSSIVLSSASS